MITQGLQSLRAPPFDALYDDVYQGLPEANSLGGFVTVSANQVCKRYNHAFSFVRLAYVHACRYAELTTMKSAMYLG